VSMAGWFTAWSCLRACPADHEFHSRSDQLAVVLTAVVYAESRGKPSTELNASASHHAFKYTPMVARCDHQKQGKQGPPIWPERQNAPLHSCAIINLLRFTVVNQAGKWKLQRSRLVTMNAMCFGRALKCQMLFETRFNGRAPSSPHVMRHSPSTACHEREHSLWNVRRHILACQCQVT
jgi:hypothetical protein